MSIRTVLGRGEDVYPFTCFTLDSQPLSLCHHPISSRPLFFFLVLESLNLLSSPPSRPSAALAFSVFMNSLFLRRFIVFSFCACIPVADPAVDGEGKAARIISLLGLDRSRLPFPFFLFDVHLRRLPDNLLKPVVLIIPSVHIYEPLSTYVRKDLPTIASNASTSTIGPTGPNSSLSDQHPPPLHSPAPFPLLPLTPFIRD
ncbi:hypothetical protein BD414DRAFT_140082 [Trametes punicea]|nr:hypothetical protein BD414DRAFT_140082 [Trametes punicea]